MNFNSAVLGLGFQLAEYRQVLSRSVLLTGTNSPWSDSHLAHRENLTWKGIPIKSHSIKCQRIRSGKIRKLSLPPPILYFPSAPHPLPKPTRKCFSMTSLLPVFFFFCFFLRFPLLSWGKQVNSMSWHGSVFYNFPSVEFLPFVLLRTIITVWFNCSALFYPSARAKHAGNERQRVSFWNH